MTAARTNNKTWLQCNIGYLISLATIIFTACSNYIVYTNKVDQLTASVAQLTTQVEKLSDKLDQKDERATQTHNRLAGRITALEVKVFGQVSATQVNLLAYQK